MITVSTATTRTHHRDLSREDMQVRGGAMPGSERTRAARPIDAWAVNTLRALIVVEVFAIGIWAGLSIGRAI